MKKYYIITARNSLETLYFVSDATQGSRMIRASQSRAYGFDSKEKAIKEIEGLRMKYKGLNDFKVEHSDL